MSTPSRIASCFVVILFTVMAAEEHDKLAFKVIWIGLAISQLSLLTWKEKT